MVEDPCPKSTEAQPAFHILLLYRPGAMMGLLCNQMPLVGNFQKSPGNEGSGLRSRVLKWNIGCCRVKRRYPAFSSGLTKNEVTTWQSQAKESQRLPRNGI